MILTMRGDNPSVRMARICGNRHAQYTALAQMWTLLGEEAEERRAVLNQAQDAFKRGAVCAATTGAAQEAGRR
jgi:hypothetical protein